MEIRSTRTMGFQIRELTGRIRHRLYFGFAAPPHDGMQNIARMRFLYDVVRFAGRRQSGAALEIGVYKGCSMIYLSKACLALGIEAIYGMDLFTGTPSWGQHFDTYDEAAMRLKSYRLDSNVELIRSDSRQYPWKCSIDVLHIDADHEYDAVRRDIEKYTPFLVLGGLVVFDDYDDSHPGVVCAVDELIAKGGFENVAVNRPSADYGSICLRRVTPS
jgi:predicted O-methyltransferase YrrM